MTYTVFKSIKVCNPATNFNETSDVIILNDKIISISKKFNKKAIKGDNKVIFYDCAGLIMAPGILDMRVNLGKTENLELTQETAMKNGITSMVILPNQTPKLNNPSIIEAIERVPINIAINPIAGKNLPLDTLESAKPIAV